jgi:hypothetical protein
MFDVIDVIYRQGNVCVEINEKSLNSKVARYVADRLNNLVKWNWLNIANFLLWIGEMRF